MCGTGAARRGEIDLAAGEPDLAGLPAVEVDDGERVHVVHRQGDAASLPRLGNGYRTLIPRRGEAPQRRVLPAGVGVKCLTVLLDVAGVPRPEPGNLEVAPLLRGDGVGEPLPRLPLPEAVQAHPFAGAVRLAVGLLQIPDGLHTRGKGR